LAAVVDVGAEVGLDEEEAELAVLHVAAAVGEARRGGFFEVERHDVRAADGVDFVLEVVAVLARDVPDLVDGAVDVAGGC
jgi:hypothetical protein